MAINNEYVPIDNQPTIKPRTITGIFTKYIAKTLPLAFDESMSYYECLCALLEYLNKTIVPDINNLNEGMEEIQNLYIELQTYINNAMEKFETDVNNKVQSLEDFMNNYFDNLDVQEEINNKLDQMLKDGQLEQIIEQFIQSTALWCFDTVAEMKEATNLINGSYVRTLGYYSLNDGGGATYKITEDASLTEYQEKLDSGLYATLIWEDYIYPEQLGAHGDGTTDDYSVLNTCVSYAKTTLKPIKLNKSYYIGTSIILNGNDTITMVGKNTGKWGYYGVKDEIIIGNNSLFTGVNLNNNSITRVTLNLNGIRFKGTRETKGTLFKGLELIGSIIENCQFTELYGVLEGNFHGVSQITKCQTMNIKNFFMSDYIFTTPTDMKDLRDGTTSIDSVTSFNVVNADSNGLFDNCYFNGYNPATPVAGIEKPCFHLLHSNDSELCGYKCFIDFWYAIEESYRPNGITQAMSWKDCVFEQCCYFFFLKTGYPMLLNFEFIGNELSTFGGNQTTISDVSNYTDVKLNNLAMLIGNANILNNYFKETTSVFLIVRASSYAITSNNRVNSKIDCPLIPSEPYQWYNANIIEESRYEELNDKTYEVASVPTTISRTAGSNNGLGLYFLGKKFVFKVNTDYYYRTLIKIDNDNFMFI